MCKHIVFYHQKCNCVASGPICIESCGENCLVNKHGFEYACSGFQHPYEQPGRDMSSLDPEYVAIPSHCVYKHRGQELSPSVGIKYADGMTWYVPTLPDPKTSHFREVNWNPTSDSDVKLDDNLMVSPKSSHGSSSVTDTDSTSRQGLLSSAPSQEPSSRSCPTQWDVSKMQSTHMSSGSRWRESKLTLSSSLPELRERRRQQRQLKQPATQVSQTLRSFLSMTERLPPLPKIGLVKEHRINQLGRHIERELKYLIPESSNKSAPASLSFQQAIWTRLPEAEPYVKEYEDLKPAALHVRPKRAAVQQLHSVLQKVRKSSSQRYDSSNHNLSPRSSVKQNSLGRFSAKFGASISPIFALGNALKPSLNLDLPKLSFTSLDRGTVTQHRFSFQSPLSSSLEFLDFDLSSDEEEQDDDAGEDNGYTGDGEDDEAKDDTYIEPNGRYHIAGKDHAGKSSNKKVDQVEEDDGFISSPVLSSLYNPLLLDRYSEVSTKSSTEIAIERFEVASDSDVSTEFFTETAVSVTISPTSRARSIFIKRLSGSHHVQRWPFPYSICTDSLSTSYIAKSVAINQDRFADNHDIAKTVPINQDRSTIDREISSNSPPCPIKTNISPVLDAIFPTNASASIATINTQTNTNTNSRQRPRAISQMIRKSHRQCRVYLHTTNRS